MWRVPLGIMWKIACLYPREARLGLSISGLLLGRGSRGNCLRRHKACSFNSYIRRY